MTVVEIEVCFVATVIVFHSDQEELDEQLLLGTILVGQKATPCQQVPLQLI